MGLYQNLETQFVGPSQGYPQNSGIQYDWEVPNNLVVSSPGGVSGIQHHWTKGFYGSGNTSSDIYAGQGYRYGKEQVYGDMYGSGFGGIDQTNNYFPPPDIAWWNNQPLQQNSYSSTEIPTFQPPQTKESFVMTDSLDDGIEYLDDSNDKIKTRAELSVKSSYSPWLLFLLFVFAFIAFDFWAETGRLFINDHLRAGKKITWKSTLSYAVLITIIFALLLWLVGVPLTVFETV